MDAINNRNAETFNTMHKLEQAGMSRAQAEITARSVERQTLMTMQEVLDKIDARFDAHEARYEARFQAIENRIDALEKRLSWLYIESIVAISVIGVGFTGVIIALLRLG